MWKSSSSQKYFPYIPYYTSSSSSILNRWGVDFPRKENAELFSEDHFQKSVSRSLECDDLFSKALDVPSAN